MPRSSNGITKLFTDSIAMGFAANQVIAIRLMKMALGQVDSKRESHLMVTEKMEAATEAAIVAAQSVATGNPHEAPGRALTAYSKRVNRNLRRLSRG